MNRILTVPNWSFYGLGLTKDAESLVIGRGLTAHYFQGDLDHQRTVTAFSGSQSLVFDTLLALADLILPYIDLELQLGVHPRVGALDVAPFVLLEGSESDLIEKTCIWASIFSNRFDVPVHLYEKAAKPKREHRLPYLRGQHGDLNLAPDFGKLANPKWGKTIVGVRNFLLAANLNLSTDDIAPIRSVAKEMRLQREKGLPALRGVRALAFQLKSRNMTQLSLNFTEPDHTSFDAVFELAVNSLLSHGTTVCETELIGVIRPQDLEAATHLTFEPSQVVR